MSNVLNKYNELKTSMGNTLEWVGMLGKRYSGGGGGIGELRSISLSGATIYYQYSNGSTNYHDMPKNLFKHLESVIMDDFTNLISIAVKKQDAELKACAKAAMIEHKELMRSAGIDMDNQEQA